MFNFLKISLNSSPHVLIDIGSGSVRGALVYYNPKKQPHIIYSARIPITYEAKPSSTRYLTLMNSALASVLKGIETEGVHKAKEYGKKTGPLKHFHVFLASPWFSSKTETVFTKNKKPFVINTEFLSKTVLENRSVPVEVETNRGGRHDLKEKSQQDILPIERKMMKVKLNGYQTSEYYLRNCLSFEAVIFTSYSSRQIIANINNAIHGKFPDGHVEYHTAPIVFLSSVLDSEISPHNFLLIDVRSEITDIAMVKDGVIAENFSFPVGKNFLLRALSREFRSGLIAAESYLRMFSAGKTDHETETRIEKQLNSARAYWLKMVQDALRRDSHEIFIPKKARLIVDSPYTLLFGTHIPFSPEEEMSPREIISQSDIEVSPLKLEDFFEGAELNRKYPDDIFNLLNALFIQKILTPN